MICVIGAFGFDRLEETTGGQPVKTRQLFYALVDKYGEENITYIETYGWKSNPFGMLKKVIKEAKGCDAMIMLPAHHGVQIFARLLTFCKKRYNIKIFYDVVGGWLAEKTMEDQRLTRQLNRFDGIWVETSSMKTALDIQGFTNIEIVPNFKKLKPVEVIKQDFNEPYPLCTFARVMKEKGVEDAIEAVKNINEKVGHTIYTLDMYGPIHEPYKQRFNELQKSFPDYIRYQGVVSPEESVDTIKDYYALLFPTYYYTEGIPGTLIDALFAAVPVITAKWANCGDIYIEDITGWGYEFDNRHGLEELLERAALEKDIFLTMRNTCRECSETYRPEVVVNRIDKLMNK